MIFAGIKNEQEINDLWAYLKQFDADGNQEEIAHAPAALILAQNGRRGMLDHAYV